jgi:autotransporter-associated beta strand protein
MAGRMKKRWLVLSAAVAGVSLFGSKSRADLNWDPTLTNTANGGGAGTWDNTTANWFNGSSDVPWDSTGATFGGPAGGTVTVDPGGVSATGLTFNTTGYTLAGTGAITLTATNGITLTGTNNATISAVIAGSSGLALQSGGVLTLSGANTFTGSVSVNAGTLRVGANGANVFNNGQNGITIASGATLDTNNQDLATVPMVTVSGSGVNGNGAIVNNTASGATLGPSAITLTGDTTFGGIGRWDLRNGVNNSSLLTTADVNLTKVGTNTIALVNVTSDNGLKTVTVNEGQMSLEGPSGDGNLGDPTANLVINGANTVGSNRGGLFYLWNLTPVFHKQVVINGGTFQSLAGVNTMDGSITLAGAGLNTIDTNVNTSGLTLTGTNAIISGTGSLQKTGPGTLTLANASTYTGSTMLSGGYVILQASNGIHQNAPLVVNRTSVIFQAGEDQTYPTLDGAFIFQGANNLITSGTIQTALNIGAGKLTVDSGNYNGQIIASQIIKTNTPGTFSIGGYTNTVSGITLNGGGLRTGLSGPQLQGYFNNILGTGPVNINGGTVALQSGGGAGLVGARLSGTMNMFGANTGFGLNRDGLFAVGTVAGQDNNASAGAQGIGTNNDMGLNWKDSTTFVYTGKFFFPGNSNNNSITFGKAFDDSLLVRIDGYAAISNWSFNQKPIPITTVRDLAPGWHDIEIRFGQGVGGVGTVQQGDGGWLNKGFGIDLQGRNTSNAANFLIPVGTNVGTAIQINANAPVVNYGTDLNINNTTTIDMSNGALQANFGNLTLAAGQTLTLNGTNGRPDLGLPNIVPTLKANSTTINDTSFTHGGNANLQTGTLNLVGGATAITVNNTGTSPRNGLGGLYADGTVSSGSISSVNVTQGVFGIIGNNGVDPLTLAVPINVNGANAGAAFGATGINGTTFNEGVVFNAAGRIQHVGLQSDTYSGAITANGNPINFAVMAGNLNVPQATLNGLPSFTKTGDGTLTITGAVTQSPFPIQGGLVRFSGGASFGSNAANLQGGGIVLDSAPGSNGVGSGMLLQFYGGAIQGFFNGTAPNVSYALIPQFLGLQQGFYNSTPTSVTATFVGGVNPSFDNTAGGNAAAFTSIGAAGTTATSYAVRFTGYYDTTTTGPGVYNFATRSDDGSILYVDGVRVVDNNIAQGMQTRSGTIALSAGKHELMALYWQNGGGNGFDLMVLPPNADGTLNTTDWTNSASDISNNIPTSQLTPSTTTPLIITQDINVSGTNPSTLASTLALYARDTGKVIMQPGSRLLVQGAATRLENVIFNGAGTYSFGASPNSAVNEDYSLGSISAGGTGVSGIVIDVNSPSTLGALVLDSYPNTNNARGAITFQSTFGNMIVAGSNAANTNPLGNPSNSATVALNGGNVFLTSRSGTNPITFDNPFVVTSNSANSRLNAQFAPTGFGSNLLASGTNPAIFDNVSNNGITITVGGPNSTFLVNAGGTANIGADNNYTLQLASKLTGSGGLIINHGNVIFNNTTATNVSNFAGDININNSGVTLYNTYNSLQIFSTNQGQLTILAASNMTNGRINVNGGLLNLRASNGVNGSAQIIINQNATNAGVVDTQVAGYIPTISTNSTGGVLAIDASMAGSVVINMANIGAGNSYLGTVNGTNLVAQILPGAGNVYRFSVNAYNQNSLLVFGNLADTGSGAASVQVGLPTNARVPINNGGAGSGNVVLMGSNTFSGGATVSEGQLVFGTSSSIGSGPITIQMTGIDQANMGSNNVYLPITFSNTVNMVNGFGTQTTNGVLGIANRTVWNGALNVNAGLNAQISGINTGNLSWLTWAPTVQSNRGQLNLINNAIFGGATMNVMPAQGLNIGNGTIFQLDHNGTAGGQAMSFLEFLNNRTGLYSTTATTALSWQMGSSAAFAGIGAGETLLFPDQNVATLGFRSTNGTLVPTSFFNINYQIGSERIVNNVYASNAPITVAQPTQIDSSVQGGTTRRAITIGNQGQGLIGNGAINMAVAHRITGGITDGSSAGMLEIRSTVNAQNDAHVAEVVFGGTGINNWTGNFARDGDGGGNIDFLNTGPGGLIIAALSGNTEATPADVFVRFDDNQINPGNVNGVGNPSFTVMPTGNFGGGATTPTNGGAWLMAIGYDQGARNFSGYRHGYMITGGGTNNESYELPQGYQFLFGQIGGNAVTGAGTLGSAGGLATLQGSTVNIMNSGTATASTLDVLVRDGQLTLGAAGATNAVLFRDFWVNAANNIDTDHGFTGGATLYGPAGVGGVVGTPLTDAQSPLAIRSLAKRGPGTLVLSNFDFIDASDVVGGAGGTASTLFQWQLGGGSQTAVWDGGVTRETNTNSANSSLVGNFRVLFAGGILGLDANNGDFNRNIGTSVGQVNLAGVGGGGWAAYGAPHTVTLAPATATATFVGTAVSTGVPGASSGMFANRQPVMFGADDSTDSITLTTNLNLNGVVQNFQVDGGLNNSPGILSGQLTNGGLAVGPMHIPVMTAAGAMGIGTVKAGTLILTNTSNNYAGLTIVSDRMTLKAGVAGALSPNSVIVANKDGTVDLNGTGNIGGIGGAGNIIDSSNSALALNFNQNVNSTFLGSMATNAVSLTKGGIGALKISNTALSYSGPTTINGGMVTLESADNPTDAGVRFDFSSGSTNLTSSGVVISNSGSQGTNKNAIFVGGANLSVGTGPKGNNSVNLFAPAGNIQNNNGNSSTNTGNEYVQILQGPAPTNTKGFDLNPTGATGTGTNTVAWTANAWFNGIQLPGNRTMFRGFTNDHQAIFNNNTGAGGNFELGNFDNTNGGFRDSGYDATSVATGWHMLTAVGQSNGAVTELYIDGAFVGQTDRKSITDIYSIGSYFGNNQEVANQIADVSLFNRALSTAEISAVYKTGLGVPVAQANNLLPTTTPLTINNGGLTLSNVNQTVASLSGAQFTKVNLGNNTLTLGPGASTTTFAGDVSGTGSIVHNAGAMTLSGNNTFSGGLTVGATSSVTAASANALGAGFVTLQGGTLNIAGGSTFGTSVAGFGSNGAGWQFNGTVSAAANVLSIASNAGNQAGSAFFLTQQSVTNGFTASFTYTAAGARTADGATFVVQNSTNGAAAIGSTNGSNVSTGAGLGGALGYGGMLNSAAIELNIFPNNTIGTRFGSNGATGGPYLNSDPVNLASGDAIKVTVEYSGGTTLAETMLDTVTGQSYFTSYALATPLSTILNGNNAFIGFTGATGGSTATHQIGSFVFSNALTPYTAVTYTNTVALAATSTVDPLAGITATLSGTIIGPGGLVVGTNGGTLVLTNTNNTYLGGTTINGDTLSVSADANLGNGASGITMNGGTLLSTGTFTSPRSVTLNAVGTVDVTSGNTLTLSGVVSGVGGLTKGPQAGTLVVNNTNTYSGGTILNGGTLSVSADANLGNATSGVTINAANLLATSTFSSARPFNINDPASTISITGANTLTLTGPVSGVGTLNKGGTNTGSTLALATAGDVSLGGLTVNAGAVTTSSVTRLNVSGNITVASGANLTMVPSNGTSAAGRLTHVANNLILNGAGPTIGNVDLGNHELLLNNANPQTIKGYLASAYDPNGNADWGQRGLTSSIAKANPTSYSVGYAYGSDQSQIDAGVTTHGGALLGPTQTLTRPVLTGDANMDGTVDFFDISQVLGYRYNAGQGTTPAAYTDGDLDYNGQVDFFDIVLLLSANYNSGQFFGPGHAGGLAAPAAAAAGKATPSLTSGGHSASVASSAIAASTTIGTQGDGKPDFEYNPQTGDLKFRTDGGNFTTTGGSASFVSSLTISSASGILLGGGASAAFAGGTGATLTSTLLSSALTNSPGFSDGFDIGLVLAPGLSSATLTADLTVKYQSLNGGSLKTADITVPEPTALAFVGLGAAGLMARRRRRSQGR